MQITTEKKPHERVSRRPKRAAAEIKESRQAV